MRINNLTGGKQEMKNQSQTYLDLAEQIERQELDTHLSREQILEYQLCPSAYCLTSIHYCPKEDAGWPDDFDCLEKCWMQEVKD
jgi:hypothetical protein